MSCKNNGGGHGRKQKYKSKIGEKSRQILETMDDTNPVIKMFTDFRQQLDSKADRYERIVKLSRDITIESKRIIFLLHGTGTDVAGKREQIFTEANSRLKLVVDKHFKAIALELENMDPYPYTRGYTCGLQEFIEALTFYQYLTKGTIDPYEETNKMFQFELPISEEPDSEVKQISCLFPQVDFFQGIADFTGELMRRSINNLSSGNIDDCFKSCQFAREIQVGFLSVTFSGAKYLSRKVYTLRQSVAKMEKVCYNLRVRGSEIPKHMLSAVADTEEDEMPIDEGFF